MSPAETSTDLPGPSDARRPGPATALLLALLAAYRWTARWRRAACRFHPTCSTYAVEAIECHGAVRGGVLTLRRLIRCHPWNPGGVDHVPRN